MCVLGWAKHTHTHTHAHRRFNQGKRTQDLIKPHHSPGRGETRGEGDSEGKQGESEGK